MRKMLRPMDYSLRAYASHSALKIIPTINIALYIYIEVEAAYSLHKHLQVAGTSLVIYLDS